MLRLDHDCGRGHRSERVRPVGGRIQPAGFSGLWRNPIAHLDWWNLFDITYHQDLTVALERRSPDEVKRHIYQHNEHVKRMVREKITDNGGEI